MKIHIFKILTLLAISSADACEDSKGKFWIPDINAWRNCQYVKNQDPGLCATSRKVKRKCQLSCEKCRDPNIGFDCADTKGKFRIPEIDEIRNCQYVRNQNSDLCLASRKVKRRCPSTCNQCGIFNDSGDHHGHDHDHTNEHLLMTCDNSDDLYVEHIDEINEYCDSVISGDTKTCPYKCLQPMTVLKLFYNEVCPDMVRSATYDLVEASGVCDLGDPWHPPEADDACIDTKGKFRIPEIDEIRNCQYVGNQNLGLCDSSRKVKRRCPLTCSQC